MVVSQHSLHDPSRAPEEKHTLYVYAHVPYSPSVGADQVPSLARGDIFGGSCDPDQQLLFRPAPELVRYRTSVRGLYLGGASVHPGGGVHGVPGAGAAQALLRDRRRRRFGWAR